MAQRRKSSRRVQRSQKRSQKRSHKRSQKGGQNEISQVIDLLKEVQEKLLKLQSQQDIDEVPVHASIATDPTLHRAKELLLEMETKAAKLQNQDVMLSEDDRIFYQGLHDEVSRFVNKFSQSGELSKLDEKSVAIASKFGMSTFSASVISKVVKQCLNKSDYNCEYIDRTDDRVRNPVKPSSLRALLYSYSVFKEYELGLLDVDRL